MGVESSGDHPRVKGEQGTGYVSRRWLDKALMGAIAAIIALIGTVYGVHTREIMKADDHAGTAEKRVETHAEKVKVEIDLIHLDQRSHAERIRALEENRSEINRRLDSIDKSLERQDVKHDEVSRKIDRLLERGQK